ncbi:MAG: zf-HC2 domain-containing protein [Actinomycetota bacterium]|nr:zf-HC2 domain-containing protein [Actinomycetota bacterium]
MSSDELSCRELVELVTDYLEGVLSDEERARFDEHVGGCPGCSAYLEQMRTTVRLTGALREEDIVPTARDALLQAFRSWARG